MNLKEVQLCFAVLWQQDRLIFKLAIMAGMRPGEIFALSWGRLTSSYVDIRQRVNVGAIDSPKTNQSIRKAALPEGLLLEIEACQPVSLVTQDNVWMCPSERMTPMSKDNCWNRNIKPKAEKVGLGWPIFS
jgi:integrase